MANSVFDHSWKRLNHHEEVCFELLLEVFAKQYLRDRLYSSSRPDNLVGLQSCGTGVMTMSSKDVIERIRRIEVLLRSLSISQGISPESISEHGPSKTQSSREGKHDATG